LSPTCDFMPNVLRGLSDLGPVPEPDLALELGLSAWMRISGIDLADARAQMLSIRSAVIEAGDLDPATEPIPFSGRTSRVAVLNLAAYLGNLMKRASSSSRCQPDVLVERVIGRLQPS
jgi:hypothetical protein